MSVQAQAEVKPAPAPAPALTPAPAEYALHTCACGGSHGLGGECEECRRKRLRVQRRALNTPEFSAWAVYDRLGHDFGRMSVTQARNGPIDGQEARAEQEADRAARQVAQGIAPALNRTSTPFAIRRHAGEEAATSEEDLNNSNAETTEAAGPAVAEAAPEAASPETKPAPETEAPVGESQAAGLIVEDDTSPGPGQMSKSAFLDELRTSACAVADAELAAVGRSTEGCPYIERWISYYRTKDSSHVERAIRKYAPETASVTSARDYIPLVNERIRQGVARWAQTGDLSGVPAELLSQASGAGLLSGIGSAVSSAVGSLGGLFFKAREGGAKETDPQTIQAQLRSGHPLDGSVRTRMESAFGYDFSRVRVHTDGQAANLSASLNARAFTVGSDVAFGAGEYQPGTLVGDALLAHELAHVVQQGGAASTEAPLQKGGAYTALEEDADQSAVGAVVSLWSGAKGGLAHIAQHAMPQLKSGLRLSRCKNESAPSGAAKSAPTATPSTAPPMKTVSLHIVHLEKGPASHAADLTKAEETYKVANVKFNVVKSLPFDDAKTKGLIGNDYILDEYTSVGTPTAEETKLLAEPDGRTAGAISMYYVKGLSHGSTGESFWPKDWPKTPASVVISSTDTKETFSHELGHVLLDDGGHHPNRDNLMFQPNFSFNLDETQRKTIYNSSFAK